MGRAQTIWSVVIVVVTAATAALVWSHLRTYLTADRQVVAARDAQRALYELALILQDAESGARGFVLTSLPRHRSIFDRAASDVEARMSTAEQAVHAIDRMRDFAPLEGFVLQRLELIRRMVALTADGKPSEAAMLLQDESTDRLGLSVRQEMETLISFANSLLEQRLAVCRQSMMAMTRWVAIGTSALLLSGAVLVGCMVRDVRRQRELTAELRRARDGALAAAHARDDFLNVLSHELRTPLTPALLAVSGMERRSGLTFDDRQELTMVRRQLELEARIIDDLLDVSRILRGDVVLRSEQVSVHTLLKHLCDILAEDLTDGELKLTCSLDAANDQVMGSESRLHQVFWHLLANAIKFTPTGGHVSVGTTNQDGRLIVTITDTGIGMSAHQLPTIFEAFANAQSSRTRMFGGLGVGLAIVKSVVEMHQGNVTVHSEGKDKGASFRVELPVVGAA